MAIRNRKDKVIPMVLNTGMDAGTDPKVSPGFTKLENVAITRHGTFTRRDPTEEMDTTNNTVIAKHKDRPVLIGTENYEVWNKSSLTDATGAFESAVALDDWGDAATFPQEFHDVALAEITGSEGRELFNITHMYYDKYLFIGYTYQDPTDNDYYKMRFRTYNRYSGQLYATYSPTLDTDIADEGCRFAWFANGRVMAFFVSVDMLTAVEYDTTNNVWGDEDGVANTLLSSSAPDFPSAGPRTFDVCSFGSTGTSCLIVYADTNSDATLISMTPSVATFEGAWTGSISTIALTISEVYCCPYGSSDAVVAYINSNTLTAIGYDSSLSTTITADTTAATSQNLYGINNGTITGYNNGNEFVALATSSSTYLNHFCFNDNSGTGEFIATGAVSGVYYPNHCRPYSKPFIYGSGVYQWIALWYEEVTADGGFKTLVLVELVSKKPVAKCLVGVAGGDHPGETLTSLADVTVDSNGYHMAGAKRVDELATAIVMTTGQTVTPQAIETPHGANLISSISYLHNNQQMIEHGWITTPHLFTATASGSGSGIALGAGTYSYLIVLERRDAQGNVVRSAPTPAVSVTTVATNDYVAVAVPTLESMTYGKNIYPDNDWSFIIYRTLLNGAVYYRLPVPGPINDNYADSAISSNETIYTTGGVLENTQPPQSRCGAIFQDRLFLVDREQEDSIVWYSKKFTDGLSIEYNDTLSFACSAADGRIYALASMDDKLYMFKAGSIYATYGNGLNDVGAGQNYATPILISNAIGCINRDSIVLIPEGLMFESKNGICLLTRGGEVKYIGEAVKYWYEQMTLSCAVHHKTKNEVIFLDSGSNGRALVYNYKFKIWSTRTNHKADSAVIVDDKLAYIADGAVRIEDASLSQDDDANMSMTLETGWISLGKIAGYQRIRNLLILGQNIADSTVTVKAQYDYTPVWEDTQTYDTSDLENFDYTEHFGAGLSAGTYADQAMLLKVVLSQQKCTSVRFQIVITSTGLGVDLTALALVVNMKPGQARLEGNRRL